MKMASMTSISVISTMRDKESFSTMSNMIDPETSVDNLVNHAAAHQKLGTVVSFSLFSFFHHINYLFATAIWKSFNSFLGARLKFSEDLYLQDVC